MKSKFKIHQFINSAMVVVILMLLVLSYLYRSSILFYTAVGLFLCKLITVGWYYWKLNKTRDHLKALKETLYLIGNGQLIASQQRKNDEYVDIDTMIKEIDKETNNKY